MTSWVEQLQARGRPTTVVPLPGRDGASIAVELRALPPEEWDALCALHLGAEPGIVDAVAMRPALLAATVVADENSPTRDPAWWAAQAKSGLFAGEELTLLSDAAWELHRRDLQVAVGKASAATPS